jgi:NAD(P)-dependent dehydrogenase (short-subunit alcohol dehydrogenase family)
MRRVLITGGASGLGAALVARALASGDRVTVIDRAPPPPGTTARWLQADLAAPDFLTTLVTGFDEPHDLIVHSAGIGATGRFESIPEADQHAVISVNLTAPAILTAHLLQAGLIAPGGRVVLVGSLSSFTGYPGAAVYAGTKDGLLALARSLRRPLWRAGRIRVQLVAPGPMDTPHAARHAPPGASGRGRLDPQRVAAQVLAGRGGMVLIPGALARALALMGRLAPGAMTGLMRRTIYARFPVATDPVPVRAVSPTARKQDP